MTFNQLKQLHRKQGYHFFDPRTMTFFRSRVEATRMAANGGLWIVTSEQHDDTTPRRYTLRLARADGHMSTIGNAYTTLAETKTAMKHHVELEIVK